MNPAGDYDYLIGSMRNQYDNVSTIVGVLFANPNRTLVKQEILENLEYANKRSGTYIDFYFAGYSEYKTYDEQEKVICAPNGKEWYFSPKMYIDFINKFEECSKWKYSGETELLLLEYKNGTLCFDKVILLWIEKLVRDANIYSVSNLFETIYRVARDRTEISKFSYFLIYKKIKGSVFDIICSYINEKFRKIIKSTIVYAIKDFSK